MTEIGFDPDFAPFESQSETATLRIEADLMSDLAVFRNVFELRAICR